MDVSTTFVSQQRNIAHGNLLLEENHVIIYRGHSIEDAYSAQ